MKTVAFYSYKGGTGKSLASANFAIALSKMGINSVLLDLDTEGPSLQSKFSSEGQKSLKGGGWTAYFRSQVGENLWSVNFEQVLLRSEDQKSLAEFSHVLPSRDGRETDGKIVLIPAGDSLSPTYWDTVTSPIFRFVLSPHLSRDKDLIDEPTYQRYREFFHKFFRDIASLETKPEYLILDMPPGANEIMGTYIAEWVDVLVAMFSFNNESMEYMGTAIQKLRCRMKGLSVPDFAVLPVLSRVPSSCHFRGDRVLINFLDRIGVKSYESLFLLRSERDLEMNEALLMGFMGVPTLRGLAYDYLKLFTKILNVTGRESAEKDELREKIGLPADLHEEERVFRLETERGAMINLDDESRNVSFRVETFRSILDGIQEGLGGGNSDGQDVALFSAALRIAGEKCGRKFGATLSAEWKDGIFGLRLDNIGEDYKVALWCKFDSSVGFGKFSLDHHSKRLEGNKLTKGTILLRESFLTTRAEVTEEIACVDTHHSYCQFMEGYVEGVLREILDPSLNVIHSHMSVERHEEHYGRGDQRSESCVFEIKRA